jgi:hypothetical protein
MNITIRAMDETEFDRRYQSIDRETAQLDRRLAALFVESLWTQDKIAEHIHMSQRWVSYQLRFGRFLSFSTVVLKEAGITEGAFRECWESTDPNFDEEERFQAVEQALGFEPTPIARPLPSAPAKLNPQNSAALVNEICAELGIVHADRVVDVRAVVKNGAPNIIEMLRKKQVGLQRLARYVRNVPEEEQLGASVEGVQRYVRDSLNTAAGRPAKKKTPKPKRPNFMKRAPLSVDLDVNLSKLDIGTERTPMQPVHLWPVRVQQLNNDSIVVRGAQSLVSLNNHLDIEGFLKSLNRMLAYVPVKGKTNGEETDFAKMARRDLKRIAENLDPLIDKLTALKQQLP